MTAQIDAEGGSTSKCDPLSIWSKALKHCNVGDTKGGKIGADGGRVQGGNFCAILLRRALARRGQDWVPKQILPVATRRKGDGS
ncbi:hypothetical protein [Roseovarius tibetensis]|uniref:hypothetical protein n=1 Tax=Roseovarius tibetensis TaxID=2685897 RepID=UPI003D7FE432